MITLLTLFPGRGLLRGEDVAWTERGHRLAWRVMLIEKTGLVVYRVVEPKTGRVWRVSPAEGLTALQHKQLRTQPDLIRDYAIQLKAQHAAEGRDVVVTADAWASLNGRPAQRLLRADLNLTQPLRALDEAGWILPRQTP
jgi:vitamin K-dependent gamma-carboxylase